LTGCRCLCLPCSLSKVCGGPRRAESGEWVPVGSRGQPRSSILGPVARFLRPTNRACWSRSETSRLVTRTEECKPLASLRVQNRKAQRNQVFSVKAHQPATLADRGFVPPSRRSKMLATRKKVNLACPGRRYSKEYWRAVAVLTCKLIVRCGLSGERLIEPSSRWFLPKFLSGQLYRR